MGELIPITLFVIIAVIVKMVLDNGTRRLLIEKGVVDEKIKYLFGDTQLGQVPSALKWGMVMVAIGLAVMIGQLAPEPATEEITIGGMFLFGGIALIAYYFIATKLFAKSDQAKQK